MPKIMGSSLAEHRERTRSALFEALSDLLTHQSFDRITLSDVAAQAGVGRTAVYNHFHDKEDLLLAFMEHETAQYTEQLAASLTGTTDPVDRLRVYVRQLALIKRHFHFPASGSLASSVSRPTAGRLRSHGGRTAQLLAEVLSDAMAQGRIPRQDTSQVIPLIHACVMGGRPTPTEPAAREAYLAALDTFILRAVGADAPGHPVPAVDGERAGTPAGGPVRSAAPALG